MLGKSIRNHSIGAGESGGLNSLIWLLCLRLIRGHSKHGIAKQNPFLKQHLWYVCQKGKHESCLSGKVEFGCVWNVLKG